MAVVGTRLNAQRGARPGIKVFGTEELERAFRKFGKKAPKWTDEVVREAAMVFKKRAAQEAPHGPTGNLKRSIEMVRLPGVAPVYVVRPDYNIGPHAHLIEFGTKERFLRIFTAATGKKGRVISLGSVTPNRFMTRAFNGAKKQALGAATGKARQRLKGIIGGSK